MIRENDEAGQAVLGHGPENLPPGASGYARAGGLPVRGGVADAAGGRMSEEADLLARVMLVLWDYRESIPAARDLLDEYEALVMSTDEEENQ